MPLGRTKKQKTRPDPDESDQLFAESPQAQRMIAGLERRGVLVVDNSSSLAVNEAAKVSRVNGQLVLTYDSQGTTLIDMLHEARHVAQIQRVESAGVLGNKDIFGNSRLIGAAERGAFEYEQRLGSRFEFSAEYMNYLDSMKNYYYPNSFSSKFSASPTMRDIFNAMEPGLTP